MVWLVATFERLREWLGVADDFAVRFIPSGTLRTQDWLREIKHLGNDPTTVLRFRDLGRLVSAADLQDQGYLFLDCGRGGPFDQHVAEANRGKRQDEVASVDLLVQMSGLSGLETSVIPFVKVISENDRTGASICVQPLFDKAGATPHVPRDLRTMVNTLNELHPDQPEVVMEMFFMAMSGLEYLFLALESAWRDCGAFMPVADIDLRKMNFLTVDNAVVGLPGYLATLESYHGQSVLIAAKIAWFWERVKAAWVQREKDWQQAVRDFEEAERVRVLYRPRQADGGMGKNAEPHEIKLAVGN